ncbi:arachidonate 15-lipoxygenase [Ahniella affigens]|uniref:Arachidonate 15-lipoxygenase n=1 Tax=Ahniella affigens TaxID=2021234 RepID=A0A2P1PYZ2_9GAMM|nr:lipoxygenase family protein [Ahniella affigens]AVQ00059.1 arachidonate 15-lipoxygenase [Ahniella affigens]
MSLFSRVRPTLPQNDSPAAQQQRQEALLDEQSKYVWKDDFETLPGIPLAASVPRDDRPTITWLLEVADVGIDIVANQILAQTGRGDSLKSQTAAAAIRPHLDSMRQTIATIRSEQKATPDSPLRIVDHVAGTLLSLHRSRLDNELKTLQNMIAATYLGKLENPSLEQYRKLFVTLPLPAIADTFMDDATFARMRVAGPNSVLIAGLSAWPLKFGLSEAQYQSVMGTNDSLASALTEQRLYWLDYEELSTLKTGTTGGKPKFLCAPLALFAIPKGGGALTPVAIQLGQSPADGLFLRVSDQNSPDWWSWQMAKTFVQAAEGNYHELFVHLARTHLVIEAFAVATHRRLAPEHPLNVLLLPHFEGTLFINNSAAGSLIAEGGPIDHIFAGQITSTQTLAGSDRLAFDVTAHMLPNDLASRRVADVAALPDYPYRDDALLVWQAIQDWVRQYVSVYYLNDANVAGDTELQGWRDELLGLGKIKGLPELKDRETLISVVTMVIFTASAQHAAVNFPQKDLMSFAPAISGAAWAPVPKPDQPQSEAAWLKLLPPIKEAQEQLNVLWLLGSVHYRPLGDYRVNHWPYLPWFQDPRITGKNGPLARFKLALKAVEMEIDNRNAEREVPYPYLQPSLIPTSINI